MSGELDLAAIEATVDAALSRPWPTEPITDYCGDWACTAETCTDMTEEARERSRAWIAFRKMATPELISSLLAEIVVLRAKSSEGSGLFIGPPDPRNPYCQHPECHNSHTKYYMRVQANPYHSSFYYADQPFQGAHRWCRTHALMFERGAVG